MAKIKGKWGLNDIIEYVDLSQSVSFRSDTEKYERIIVSASKQNIECVNSDGSGSYYVYDRYAPTWDFGETEQEVSEEFYNFIQTNAVPMYPVSGIWKWNDTIPCVPMQKVKVYFVNTYGYFKSIEFISVSPGGSYDTMSMFYESYGTDTASLACTGTSENPNEISITEKARTMDFTFGGDVREEFYNYLLANAQLQSPKIIRGVWEWNETIQTMPFGAGVSATVNFTSNGESFRHLDIGKGFMSENRVSYVPTDNEYLIGKIVSEGTYGTMVKSEYRRMDFGEVGQEVDVRFYEYLVANASQLPDNFVRTTNNYVVSGQLLSDIGDAMRQCGAEGMIKLSDLPSLILSIMGSET